MGAARHQHQPQCLFSVCESGFIIRSLNWWARGRSGQEEAPDSNKASDRDHDVDDEENRFIIIKSIYKMKSRSRPRRSEMCARHRPKINTH